MMSPESVKIVLAGPVGAGKTTAIRSLADSPPVSTEMPMVGGGIRDKTTTTVALDFASIVLDDGSPILLYGLPGQDHFDFMRPILLRDAFAAILLLNGAEPDVGAQCADWLKSIRACSDDMAIVVGITQTELSPSFSMESVRAPLRAAGLRLPVFTVDARNRAQMAQLIRALLVSVE